ncbi:5-methylaminomethyl-2-thiouridylate-methyltransferase [Gorgonomyces haynaldii]|nr:5-methylaminomethyl-2-thiouridylate-methyltransferase [Gorgonomyces haynaldii]
MKVAVGMSGGVDSTVSCLLLKQMGYQPFGVFMRNWDTLCDSERDWQRVSSVCERLQVPCYRVDTSREYWTLVFEPFLDGLQKSWTPNPDIGCNQMIKFGKFYDLVQSRFHTDKIAFGHYSRLDDLGLKRAVDRTKDQSYYLSTIPLSILKNCMFPVGHLMKHQVKQIALKHGFGNIARQKESMGICFIGKNKFNQFVDEYLPDMMCDMVDLNGTRLSRVNMNHYTIGQRARISGRKLYVAAKNLETRQILVVPKQHPLLFTKQIECDWRWIDAPLEDGRVSVKYRYRSEPVQAEKRGDTIVFDSPQADIALGQHCALYIDDRCFGGGTITRTYSDHHDHHLLHQ